MTSQFDTGSQRTPLGPGWYETAFSRNIGWVSEWEQQMLRSKRVAIAGVGGVGGAHLLTLVRLGIGAFHVADLDDFELANFNRQPGATFRTLGRPKAQVLAEMARDINPEAEISVFPEGVTPDNVDRFLAGVDLFVDGFDFFVLDIRARVFSRCHELGIPAVTAAPLGMGAAYLVFMPGAMSFEAYFRLEGLDPLRRQVNFALGLSPRGFHRRYLVDPSRVNFDAQIGPSTIMSCDLCAGVTGVEALRILLGRGGVRAVPHYHHYDAYRRRWASGWLPGGNANPLQRLRLKIAYGLVRRLNRSARSREDEPAPEWSELKRILDLARWAPSGDNVQPWRFEIQGDGRVIVHGWDQADTDVYDYDGQPSLLSMGFLLETLRIAASGFGRGMAWAYEGDAPHRHRLIVDLPAQAGTEPDPLLPFVRIRSVERRRYRTSPLSAGEKRDLEAALGPDCRIRWYETSGERWRVARLNAGATRIRMSIPEAHEVHRHILDWDSAYSATGVPAAAVGVDGLTQRLMHWVMQDWRRMAFMNRFLGGTLLPRVQLDLWPGVLSGAHFAVTAAKPLPRGEGRAEVLLRAGQSLQRFWLTATRLGLVMQPALAALCFSYYARHEVEFTQSRRMRAHAAHLAERLDDLLGVDAGNALMMGRIGRSVSRASGSRSLRRHVEELILPSERDPSPGARP
jgi:sulfur-carrier protein adenylyltransferase/sulfurtransferase